MKLKYLVVLFLLCIASLPFDSLAFANDPKLNLLYKSEFVGGYCVSEGFTYDFSISNSSENGPTSGKPIGRNYVILTIYDRVEQKYVGTFEPSLLDFKWSMNHGRAVLDLAGKTVIIEWTAKGAIQVTRRESTTTYHDAFTWYVSESWKIRDQGYCTVYYEGDIAEGELNRAGLSIQEIQMVPIL